MIEKQLRRYLLPNILAMAGTSCYVLADTFFISAAQGSDGITALNLVLPVYGLMFAIGSMIGIGSATRYSLSKSLGTGDHDKYFSNAILWAFLFSLIFVFIGIFCPDALLRMLGADDAILAVGLPYTRIFLCFAPFFLTSYTFTAFVRNDGSPKIAMTATLLSGIFNIVFDYLLMFPLGMGMVGAALATGVSPIVSITISMAHYLSKRNTVRFVWAVPSVRKLFLACQLGVAAFVGEISSGVTTMVFNFLLLGLGGNLAVAAYGVVANTALVGTGLLNGVSQGLQPLASESYGKGDQDAQRRIYRHSLQIALLIAVLLVVFVVLFADAVVSAFNSEQSAELAAYAVPGIRVYFCGFLFAAVNIVKSGFLSAVGKGKESSIIAISRGVVAIVVFAFLLSRLFGMPGVWLAFPISELFTLLLGFVLQKKQPHIS